MHGQLVEHMGVLALALPRRTEDERATAWDTAQSDLRDLDRTPDVGELVTVRRDLHD
jgi:hypothetical protein